MHLVTGIGRPRLSRASVTGIRLPVPPAAEQARLLAAHRRAERAAEAARARSERAAERSSAILAAAEVTLLEGLLKPR